MQHTQNTQARNAQEANSPRHTGTMHLFLRMFLTTTAASMAQLFQRNDASTLNQSLDTLEGRDGLLEQSSITHMLVMKNVWQTRQSFLLATPEFATNSCTLLHFFKHKRECEV